MPACPACTHDCPGDLVRCPVCNAFLGSRRDLVNLGAFGLSILTLIALCLFVDVILPNLALGRAVSKVRRDDADGIRLMAQAVQAGQVSCDGRDMGWDIESFASIFLVSFTYSVKDEAQKRYAVWWVYDPGTDKVSKIQKAEEFIDGHLLRHGLKLVLPES